MRRLCILGLVMGLAACQAEPRVEPQTVVVITAGEATRARMTHLRVTVRNQEGDVVEGTPVQHEVLRGVAHVAQVPVTARDADPSRRFELTAEALDADGAVVNRLVLRAGFTPEQVVLLPVALTDPCLDHPGCPSGQTCWQGECRGACFEPPPEGAELATPACGQCQSCDGNGVCGPTEGECAGGSCFEGECAVPARYHLQSVEGTATSTCAVTDEWEVFCWGANDKRQLGLPTSDPVLIPTEVPTGGVRIRELTVGGKQLGSDGTAAHPVACGIEASSNTVVCWGSNNDAVLGLGVEDDLLTVDWSTASRRPLAERERADAVDAGDGHACLLSAGVLRCWGANRHYEAGPLADTSLNPDCLDAAVVRILEAPTRVETSHRFRSVSAGGGQTCAITTATDPTPTQLFCWGDNACRETAQDVGEQTCVVDEGRVQVAGVEGWRAVEGGAFHTCALDSDGALYCWGANQHHQVHPAAPETTPTPRQLMPGRRFDQLACGTSHCCAIEETTQALFCWGNDNFGQVGASGLLCPADTNCPREPTQVAPGMRFQAVGLGGHHTCAITTDEALYCWGRNDQGQLGLGHTRNMPLPARVEFSP